MNDTKKHRLERLQEEKARLKKQIDDYNGDFFLIYGPAKQLEKVENEIKKIKLPQRRGDGKRI